MVGILRNLILLASFFALVVSAIVPAKTDSTPCKEIIGEPYGKGDWEYLIDLKTTAAPNSPIKVYTGSAYLPWGPKCQFMVMYGRVPRDTSDHLKQSVTCQEGSLPIDFKIAYYNRNSDPYKEYSITTKGGKCDNHGGGFKFDPIRFGVVSVFYNIYADN